MSKIATAAGWILLPSLAAAHPEHGAGGDFGIGHFLTDPFHVGLAAGVIGLFLVVRRQRRLQSVRNR